jgi:hypothetical protein
MKKRQPVPAASALSRVLSRQMIGAYQAPHPNLILNGERGSVNSPNVKLCFVPGCANDRHVDEIHVREVPRGSEITGSR